MEVEEAGEVYVNYLSRENDAKLLSVTSERQNCAGSNVLEANSRVRTRQQIWVSKEGLPQALVFDISHLRKRPKELQCFGWYCWHPYSSNPAVVELWLSEDMSTYVKWARCVGDLRAGNQFFRIDPIPRKYKAVKVMVVETHGASNTYLNRLFILDTMPRDRPSDRSRSYSVLSQNRVSETPIEMPIFLPQKQAEVVVDPKTKLKSLLYELQEDLKTMQIERMLPPLRFTDSLPLMEPGRSTSSIIQTQKSRTNTPLEIRREVLDSDVIDPRDTKLKDINASVTSLAAQVKALQQTMSERTSEDMLRQLKDELLTELSNRGSFANSPGQQVSPRVRGSEEVWEQEMQAWTEQVLEPRLSALERRIQSRVATPLPKAVPEPASQSILEELNEKLNLKARKLAELERERTRKLKMLIRKSGSTSPLDSSADHVRYG